MPEQEEKTWEFFGAVDRKGKVAEGRITSEYPAWYKETAIRELANDIDQLDNRLKRGVVPQSEVPYAREEVSKMRLRKQQIVESKPQLSPKDRDNIARFADNLQEQIIPLMPTRTDMLKGLADPHEELRKDTEPCVTVASRGNNAGYLRKLNVPIHDGKITRKQAQRVLKIFRRTLGEECKIEGLRRDNSHGVYHSERSLEQMERG